MNNFYGISSRVSLIVFILCFIVGLVSCDSDKEVPIEGKLEVVKIGRLICGGHLPLAIVEKKYQDQLKTFQLETVQNHNWNDVVRDMKSGELAGSYILSPLAMSLIHDGFPGKIVLLGDRNGNGFILSNKLKNIDELNHRKSIIAVPHIFSQHHVLLHTVMKKHNIAKENVAVLGMPPRDMISSLRKGEIDGFVVGEPEGNKSIDLGVGWMAAISPQIWPGHMDHVFLATNKFIEERPDQLQELIDQLVRGGKFIEANPHEAAIMGEDYTGSSAHVFEKVLTTPPDWIDYSDMTPTEEDITAFAQKLVEMELWENIPANPGNFIDTRFVNKTNQK